MQQKLHWFAFEIIIFLPFRMMYPLYPLTWPYSLSGAGTGIEQPLWTQSHELKLMAVQLGFSRQDFLQSSRFPFLGPNPIFWHCLSDQIFKNLPAIGTVGMNHYTKLGMPTDSWTFLFSFFGLHLPCTGISPLSATSWYSSDR